MCRALIEILEHRVLCASTRFAVIGDFGNNSVAEADVAAMVKGWKPEYIVTVGDNSYPDSATEAQLDTNIGKYYHDYIYNYHGSYGSGSATRRFLPVLGNHDWGNVYPGGNSSAYQSFFDLPGNERYYDFVQGPVHFFMVDSDQNEPAGTTANSVQGQWLKAGLAAATEPHRVVMFHHASYSSGTSHGSTTRMRWPLAKWGATTVFTGHEHNYERLSEEGIPFFVNGVGGAELSGTKTPIAGSRFLYNSDFGAMLVAATDTTMDFKFYRRTGQLMDQYTLDLTSNANLIQAGSAWRYFDQGVSPGANWQGIGFSEAGWQTGAAQLGYGDGDEQTTVSFGSSPTAKYITTYFRKSFNVANPQAITSLDLSMLRDDGAVVYLNGSPVFRSNITSGTVTNSTLATSAVGADDEGNWYSSSISLLPLVAGTNVIAVELHQSAATSSDVGFDFSLKAGLDVTAPIMSLPSLVLDARPMSVQMNFSENVGATLGAADLVLENLTSGVTVPAASLDVQYAPATNRATVTFPGFANGVLPDGNWRLTVLPAGVTDPAGNAVAAALPFPFFVFGGDANHDRRVDVDDMAILAINWQQASRAFSQADFNGDGLVDAVDLGILSGQWQGSLAEPDSLATLTSIRKRTASRVASSILG